MGTMVLPALWAGKGGGTIICVMCLAQSKPLPNVNYSWSLPDSHIHPIAPLAQDSALRALLLPPGTLPLWLTFALDSTPRQPGSLSLH